MLAISYKDWIVCVTICLFSFWGLYFYTAALQKGRLSFITPLNGISYLFTVFTSVLIFNESLSTAKYLSLLLILAGLFLHQKEKLVSFRLSKEVLLTLIFNVIGEYLLSSV
jgi:uncharacterized membrane protein